MDIGKNGILDPEEEAVWTLLYVGRDDLYWMSLTIIHWFVTEPLQITLYVSWGLTGVSALFVCVINDGIILRSSFIYAALSTLSNSYFYQNKYFKYM